MHKLAQIGYKKVEVKVSAMTLGELKLFILRGYMRCGFGEIQMINITSGESTTFNTNEDVLKNEWSDDCKIEVIGVPFGYGIKGIAEKTIIIFQESEEEDNKVLP